MRTSVRRAVFTAAVLAACTSVPRHEWASCEGCTLTPRVSVTFGTNAGPAGPTMAPGSSAFARVAADRVGRYFVSPTYNEGTVSVFARHGELVQVIGHEGAGPGEFRHATRPIVGSGDSVFVWDNSNRRLTLLSPDLKYITSTNIPVVTEELVVGANYVVAGGWRASSLASDSVLIVDRSTGAIVRKLGAGDREPGRRPQVAVRHDTIYVATGGPEFEVRMFLGESEVARVSRIPDWLPTGDARHRVFLDDMTIDERGLVWMLIRYPNPDFKQQDTSERGAESPVLSVRDASRAWVKIVEVLDIEGHAVVAHTTLPNEGSLFKEFIPGPRLYALSEAPNLAPQVEIWDLILRQPDTAGLRQ